MVNDNSSADAAKEVVDDILGKGFVSEAMQADVSDGGDVAAMFDRVEELTSKISLGRLGEPDDIAKVIEFLVSENGKWITGQIIRANGGIV